MKSLFTITTLLASIIWCQAQDIILLTEGDTLHCNIVSMTASDITYLKNGQEQIIRSKKYISFKYDFAAAPAATQDNTATLSQIESKQAVKNEPSAGDHLIKSGRLQLGGYVITALGSGLVFAGTNSGESAVLGVGGAIALVGIAVGVASIYHKIKAGKKLNK